jgi:hypothetical protein
MDVTDQKQSADHKVRSKLWRRVIGGG